MSTENYELASPDHDEYEPALHLEDRYCEICESHNGHQITCATFHFNRIEGKADRVDKVLAIDLTQEGKA